MSAERLIYMANQIAANLAAQGDDVAASETAEHIARFWDPSMRAAIQRVDPKLLTPIARAAVGRLASPSDTSGDTNRD